jgi:IS30 family transposase
LAVRGGIAPANRSRSRLALSQAEREDISRGLSAGFSFSYIASSLSRSLSTVTREVKRNGGREKYRANAADIRAWREARRPKPCRLAMSAALQQLVAEKLALDWSPEQIAGWLKCRSPDDPAMQVSHETIYRSLFIQARGVLKKELMKHLRTRRVMRCSQHTDTQDPPRSGIIDAVSIRERPAEVDDRAVPGHWEGDLISGSKNSHIATLVERASRFTVLVRVEGKDTASVVSSLTRQVKKLPVQLRKTLTWDRGGELASHKDFTISTGVKVYFCDPQSPWQRGSNENTNGLLRQYFPKGSDLSVHTQADLDRVALLLNQRPRKTLSYCNPAEKLESIIASTS